MMRNLTGSILLALALVGCGGDGGGGPAGPGPDDGLDVSGTWTVTSTLVDNTCDLNIPAIQTAEAVIQQDGTRISFVVEGLGLVSGTIDLETGEFVIDVMVEDPELGSLRLQEEGTFESETRYQSVVTVTFEDEQISCFFRTVDVGTRSSS